MREYDLTLYYYLKQYVNVIYLTSSRDETIVRCPICGDSLKDSRKARFYIHNQPPFFYYCFNCDSSGVINENILNDLTHGSIDREVVTHIREANLDYAIKNNQKIEKVKSNIYYNRRYVVDFKSNRRRAYDKLDYLNDRLGIHLTTKDLSKYKIITSIRSFFKNNNLDLEKRLNHGNREKNEVIINDLEKNYIGFLSTDRSIIIFRNINPSEKRYRFNNFNIEPDLNGSSKVYNIQTTINKYQDKHSIIMTEGPIDIISAYNNVCDDYERNHNIFIANGGKGYVNSANMLAELSLLNNEFTILSDSDVDIGFYRRIKDKTPMLKYSPMSVFYNNTYKDFGVTKDKIEVSGEFIV